MDIKTKTVLYLNLEKKTAEVKTHTNLSLWIGGLGVALRLLSQNLKGNPLIFANGPFTLSFPFASKTCAVFRSPFDKEVKETYVGGRFGAALFLSGFCALIILGKARRPLFVVVEDDKIFFRNAPYGSSPWEGKGLPGRRSVLRVKGGGVLVDNYFRFGKGELDEVVKGKNLCALVISGGYSYTLPDPKGYESLYSEILEKAGSLKVTAASYPSCFGCPLGCKEAAVGEGKKEDLLCSTLIGCRFAEELYGDVPRVFSGLNTLGLTYRHEDLETLPGKIGDLKKSL